MGMIRRTFFTLSKATFKSLYLGMVRCHLYYICIFGMKLI